LKIIVTASSIYPERSQRTTFASTTARFRRMRLNGSTIWEDKILSTKF